MAELHLQVNTCFAVKNWPTAEQWLDLVDGWGISEVQFCLDLLNPCLPDALAIGEEIRKAAEKRKVSICSTFTGTIAYVQNMLLHPDPRYRNDALKWYLKAIELTGVMGAKTTGGHFGALSSVDELNPIQGGEKVQYLIESFRIFGEAAAKAGLEYLVWELMPSSRELPHTPDEALVLLERANEVSPIPIRLCFDLGHACAHDVYPDDQTVYLWLEKLLPVTPMVHLQQTDGKGDHHWPFTDEFNALGIIEPSAVKSILSRSPYPTVDLVLEILHPPEASPAKIKNDWAESIAIWR